MRVRSFQLRILASTLTLLWAAAAVLVLVGYRPGGPIDLVVGLSATLTIPVAAAGLRWPPVARGSHAYAGIVSVGVAAFLLLVPSIGGLIGQLVTRGPQTLLPSPEAAYPWLLALVATSVFSGLGLARRLLGETALRLDRLLAALGIAAIATIVVGTPFALAAIGNDIALRDLQITGSRYGPTHPGTPPPCDAAIAAGPAARVAVRIDGSADRRPLGTVDLVGTRAGGDFRWSAQVATTRLLGLYGAARIDATEWTLQRGRWDRSVTSLDGLDLDAQVVRSALTNDRRIAAENLGIATIEGARARHCRLAIDGTTFQLAFPGVAWFVGAGADLARWRGELSVWVFLDGQIGRATGTVSGPAAAVGVEGVQATLRATLEAVDRDREIVVIEPR